MTNDLIAVPHKPPMHSCFECMFEDPGCSAKTWISCGSSFVSVAYVGTCKVNRDQHVAVLLHDILKNPSSGTYSEG